MKYQFFDIDGIPGYIGRFPMRLYVAQGIVHALGLLPRCCRIDTTRLTAPGSLERRGCQPAAVGGRHVYVES